jgi:hypothetical protein
LKNQEEYTEIAMYGKKKKCYGTFSTVLYSAQEDHLGDAEELWCPGLPSPFLLGEKQGAAALKVFKVTAKREALIPPSQTTPGSLSTVTCPALLLT